MNDDPQAEVLLRAFRKIVAGLQGVGRNPVVIGASAHQAWGAKTEPRGVEILIPPGEEHRGTILSAARGEGFQQVAGDPGTATLRLRYADAKLGVSVDADLIEASTPFLRQVHGRAQPGEVLGMLLPLAACEDLILLRTLSDLPDDRAIIVELLRSTAGRMDARYLKGEAEKAGVFDKIKSAWQEAKRQG